MTPFRQLPGRRVPLLTGIYWCKHHCLTLSRRRDAGPFAFGEIPPRVARRVPLLTGSYWCEHHRRLFKSGVRLCSCAEEVAHAPFGVDESGFAGVAFDLFAEAADVDVNGADVSGVVGSPYEI